MIPPRNTLDLPPGYALQEERPDFLVLRRADGSIVGVFPLSITGPNPEMIRKAAEDDNHKQRKLRRMK